MEGWKSGRLEERSVAFCCAGGESRGASAAKGQYSNAPLLHPSTLPPFQTTNTTMKFTYLGHAAGYLETSSERFLFDPFLTGNPKASTGPEGVDPTYILLTHGHSDHLGDSVAISKRTGAAIITTFELSQWLAAQGAKIEPMNHGGSHDFSFGRVTITIAFHSASIIEEGGRPLYLGEPAGIVLETDGRTIYHAGDTALFSDMRLIAEEAPIDLALLPIGDRFTMGPKQAKKAVEFLRPKHVVPIHYGTFPALTGDPHEFVKLAKGTDAEIHVLRPGESMDF
jgi:L-ascorbate metabolism protein UlaG (beta-lactamase superfamily)